MPAKASPQRLILLAALIWIAGGLSLLLKGTQLVGQALTLQPGLGWPWGAVVFGVLLGSLKAKLVFNRSCRKNLSRIRALAEPRLWQCYRGRFFFCLFLMISIGVTLSRLAEGVYPLLVGVACLDFSIATGLLASSPIFWFEGLRRRKD